MSTSGGVEDWQTQNYTFDEAIALTGLPCVLKVRQSRYQGLSYGKTVVRIEEWKNLQCVRLKLVLSSDREELIQDDAEYEFLVPLEYAGQVRLPGSSGGKKYSKVAEVIEDLPNFVKIDEEIVALEVGTKKYEFLLPGTVLQIIRTQPRKDATGNEDELICAYKNLKLLFKSNYAISCTSLRGTAETSFDGVVANFPLPKCLQFVKQEHAVMEHLGGPRDLSSRIYSETVIAKDVEIKRVLVGVMRKIGGENELIIVPEESRNMFETVQIPKNWSPSVLKDLTMQYFPSLNFGDCLKEIQRKLYAFAPIKRQKATALQRSMSECEYLMLPKRDVVVQRQLSVSSVDGEAKTGKEKVKEYLNMVAQRSKAGFDKVHLEIKHRFKRIKKMRSDKHLYEDVDEMGVKLPPDKEKTGRVEITKFETVPVSSLRTGNKRTPLQGVEIASPASFDQQRTQQQSRPRQMESSRPRSDGNATKSTLPSKHDSVSSSTDISRHTKPQSPPIPERANQQSPSLHQKTVTQTSSLANEQNIYKGQKPCLDQHLAPTDSQRNITPAHIHSVTFNQNTFPNEQRSDQTEFQTCSTQPPKVMPKPFRASQKMAVSNNAGHQGQQEDLVPETAADHVNVQATELKFPTLSVEEVVKLYQDCGMADFAVVCDEHTLDGCFLARLTDEDFEQDPFNLSRFHMVKVKKIMSGWRPKLSQKE